MREKRFVICVQNRVLQDEAAGAEGYLRVIDEASEDYLYPADYFVFVKLPTKAKRACVSGGTAAVRSETKTGLRSRSPWR